MAQRGEVSWPRSHSLSVCLRAKDGNPWSLGCRTLDLTPVISLAVPTSEETWLCWVSPSSPRTESRPPEARGAGVPAERGGQGCPRAALSPAASLRLRGGPARVFGFSAGMGAARARLPGEGRKRAGAPGSSAGGPAAPRRGLGSRRRGRARVEPAPPMGTPRSCAAASAQGNRGRAGRGRAGPGGCPSRFPASLGLPGRPGAGWRRRGGLPPAGCAAASEQLFVSPCAARKCGVCARRGRLPRPPTPAPDLCPRGRFLGCGGGGGSLVKFGGK